VINAVMGWAVAPERMAAAAADPGITSRLRDAAVALKQNGTAWHQAIVAALQEGLRHGVSASRHGELGGTTKKLSLVDDETIEREIVTSRLALAIMDRASGNSATCAHGSPCSSGARSSTRTTCCARMSWRAS
jgi:hypothetical protein